MCIPVFALSSLPRATTLYLLYYNESMLSCSLKGCLCSYYHHNVYCNRLTRCSVASYLHNSCLVFYSPTVFPLPICLYFLIQRTERCDYLFTCVTLGSSRLLASRASAYATLVRETRVRVISLEFTNPPCHLPFHIPFAIGT